MPDYPTHCFDNFRTGWNSQETILTPAAIKQFSFGQIGACVVQGQVYAQPLVVQNVSFPNGSASDALLIATQENRIYGFDGYTLNKVWERQLLPSGEQLVTPSDVSNCNNIAPFIGITSTPAVDVQSKTMYVCAKSKTPAGWPSSPTFHHRLYRINIHNGNDAKPPVEITATINYGGQTISFNPQWQLQRPGLLLMNGFVYLGFGGHCDFHPGTYHGWVFAYDANNLTQMGAFVSTVSGKGGIWQAGRGLAGDGTFVYCQTGNANFGGNDLGDSVLKLSLGSPLLQLNGFFTPCTQQLLAAEDADLGSGGPLLLPDQPGPFPHLMVTAGKEGTVYLLNRDTGLGGYIAPPSTWNPCDGSGNPWPCVNSNQVVTALWMVLGQAGQCDVNRDALFGGPAYYAPAAQTGVNTFARIYYSGQDDFVKAFYYDNTSGKLVGPFQQSADTIADGAIPVVSSNGGQDGVLWVASRGGPNGLRQLFAYDLNPSLSLGDPNAVLVKALGAGSFSPEGDPSASPSLGPPPTVVNGHVFLGGLNQVVVFGLQKAQPSNCFIATAVEGHESPRTSTLRTFRETYLRRSKIGRRFVGWYEHFSPAVSRVLETSSPLRILARGLIVWPASLIAKAILRRGQGRRVSRS